MNMSVATNVVKQMNAKTQSDLYRINLPSFKNTMLVGVDVIMNGSSKLIGCSATNSNTLTQCYTKLFKHKMPRPQASDIAPGMSRKQAQETMITNERSIILRDFIIDAVGKYRANTGNLPEQIVVYRDGMGGPSMTTLVQEIEVRAITEAIETKQAGYKPKIIYCLVDRNIQHRLFSKPNGECLNPGPGTVVDTSLVENQGDKIYDFYLIPHKATVATAQPVLFRVAYNTSSISKDQFETSTYHLCYNYFNFAGPIKVPMVCMYAHKIATYAQENKLMPNEGLAPYLHFL